MYRPTLCSCRWELNKFTHFVRKRIAVGTAVASHAMNVSCKSIENVVEIMARIWNVVPLSSRHSIRVHWVRHAVRMAAVRSTLMTLFVTDHAENKATIYPLQQLKNDFLQDLEMYVNTRVPSLILLHLLPSVWTSRWKQTPQLTQNTCMTFLQCWANVEDVGPTLFKCNTNVLCFLRCGKENKHSNY